MKAIEFFSFDDAPSELKSEWESATKSVLSSGHFIGGRHVEKFEQEWQAYLGIDHSIGVGNGYDALHVALTALGIGRGDIVAVPSHTFIATWLAVGATGATPIGIDCNDYGLMDLEELENSVIEFSAVIPVHMHGQMVDMPRLMKWAKSKNIFVIEDCAQAHGARIDGKFAGTWGDFGAFSFYPTKNLGALGDAGALITSDNALAAKARSITNYGSIPGNKYSYQFRGINSRLDPLQAALLSVNLKYLDTWNHNRISIANLYTRELSELKIDLLPIELESVFHHFIVLPKNRNEARIRLNEAGIGTEIHYPESAQESYSKVSDVRIPDLSFKANKLSKHTLSLPISQWITKGDAYRVVESIAESNTLRSFLGEM